MAGVREVVAARVNNLGTREGAIVKRPKVGNRKRPAIRIDELLNYWIDVSKRPTFTLEDYVLFFDKADMTANHFSESYPRMSDKFLSGIRYQVFDQDRALKAAATENDRLANWAHAHMKDVAKKFINRIKKWFATDITAAINNKTPHRNPGSFRFEN